MPRLSQLSRSIADKVAIVTGAASGMGRATAYLFADEGAKVAVIDRNEEGAKQVTEDIRGAGGDAETWCLDVADDEAVTKAVDEVAERFGGIDILINNAGLSQRGPIDSDDFMQRWDRFPETSQKQVGLAQLKPEIRRFGFVF